jgi:hypothetical protein
MKNFFLLSCMLFGLVIASKAQHTDIRLHGYAIGAFSEKVDSYYSNTDFFNGTINGGLQWGAGLEMKTNPMMGVQIG